MISLLPGPVEIAPEIKAAFHRIPLYHRGSEFISHFETVRRRLAEMTGASRVALLGGSGTLANDAVAAQLQGPGVVLVNGEFGGRLADQAKRWTLPVRVIEWRWGTPWDFNQIRASLTGVEWIWAVHLETSTGMLNDVEKLGVLARAHGVRLCLDCVSSLGAVPLDLSRVWLASGVSGKSLGSYAGIAIVFAGEEIPTRLDVPAYLDLGAAMRTVGPCYTFSSPLLVALDAALDLERNYAPVARLVRERVREMGATLLIEEEHASPIITTFLPPADSFAEHCRSLGYEIGGESTYLASRGLVQIANMGAIRAGHVNSLFDRLSA